MEAKKLIDELKTKGIHLFRHGDKLKWRVSMKRGVTKAEKALLKQRKQGLLKHLEGPKTIPIPGGTRATRLFHADCLSILERMPEDAVDLIVTDPPYGYKFMGKDWDKAVPSVAIWRECLRVLKPGAFAFIMSSPRQDVLMRMIANLSEAGFKTDATSLYWTYSNGFTKAKDISKEVAKKPTCTSEAIKFDGAYKGCQLKPAVEVILMVQKPPTEKTQVGQALSNGKGITWQKDSEIPYASVADAKKARGNDTSKQGRFPANLLVSDNALDNGKPRDKSYSRYFSLDAWAERNIPFLIMPKASKGEKDAGLENMKAVVTNDGRKKPIDNAFQRGKTERLNPHPTVKPIKLMAYLITMGSREGDVVLDPFCGSGTTCMAAHYLKRRSIGIEINDSYFDIANARYRSALLNSYRKKE